MKLFIRLSFSILIVFAIACTANGQSGHVNKISSVRAGYITLNGQVLPKGNAVKADGKVHQINTPALYLMRTKSVLPKGTTLPSGDAFYHSFKRNESINLWSSKDRYHASSNGCYLAGCVWFGKLFGRSPKEITYIPDGMSEKTAKFLQIIASK